MRTVAIAGLIGIAACIEVAGLDFSRLPLPIRGVDVESLAPRLLKQAQDFAGQQWTTISDFTCAAYGTDPADIIDQNNLNLNPKDAWNQATDFVDRAQQHLQLLVDGAGRAAPEVAEQFGAHTDNIWDHVTEFGDDTLQRAQTIIDQARRNIPGVDEELRQIEDTVVSISSFAVVMKEGLKSAAERSNENPEEVATALEDLLENLIKQFKAEFPPPDQAQGHDERKERVGKFLDRVMSVMMGFCVEHGMEEKATREILEKIRLQIEFLVVTIGDLGEQHPFLAKVVVTAIVAFTAEKLLFKSILRLFGFGNKGVGRGTLAAWIQSKSYGGHVPKGGLFSRLQRSGMIR
ncbi:hypothetical protein WOLCODRAFT_20482 [Wolfiporia cocos MD-104 SS10]|uniref:Uncharacterized protein n=1 Tax=Wolfiporia cocos (strain MD-104) TaxID=742152 RepID=A0A2H3JC77_WOLCO|nr:hypothetical protein WOLCODRAFT_20482 [Wolfiporia cocos MD-104 SS10]